MKFLILFFSLWGLAETRTARIVVDVAAGTEVQIYSGRDLIKQFEMPTGPKSFAVDNLDIEQEYIYEFVFKVRGQKEVRKRVIFKAGQTQTVTSNSTNVSETRSTKEYADKISRQGVLKLYVPNRRAIVMIDGIKMEDQEGELRAFKSPVLSQGETKSYLIRIDYTDDATNRKVERQKRVYLRAGETTIVRLEDYMTELR